MKKNHTPEDVAIGGRIRMRRMQQGISQEKLGELLGVTFQQIQKYEKGVNRVSGSRLLQVATALEVSTSWLLQGDADDAMNVPAGDRYCADAWKIVAGLPSIQAKTAAINALRAIEAAFDAAHQPAAA